jgi:UDP-2,3-diacylglucosamine pyrophosphatase LpxH
MFTPSENEPISNSIAVHTIVVSDIHLGSDVCRSKQLVQLLQTHTFDRLILNGDVFDDLNFNRLSKDDWKFLGYLRKLANPKRAIEVVWVVGNHDGGVSEILSHLLGVHVHDEYVWNLNASTVALAIHGHQFDKWITKHQLVTAIASWLYLVIQKLDREHRVSRWVKRTSKQWLRLSNKVAGDAIAYAQKRHNATVVLCGHTHQPIDIMVGTHRYINSGSWTDKPSTFVTIDQNGNISLNEYH